MKRAVFVMLTFLIVFSSCRKNDNPLSYHGGFWTLGPTQYNATSCTASPASAMVTTSGVSVGLGTNYNMTFSFTDGYPTTSGTYTVLNGHNTNPILFANFVMINATLTGAVNEQLHSSGSNGSQSVTVTVSNGKISLSGSGITMLNDSNTSDSIPLSFNINQTQ